MAVGRGRRWLLIGDSITVGMRESLGATLARAGRYGTIEANIGDSVDEWVIGDDLERLRRQGAWNVVVFLLGTNPGGRVSIEEFTETVWKLASQAARFPARVLWVTPFAGEQEEERAKAIRRVIADGSVVNGMSVAAGLERQGIVSGEVRLHFSQDAYDVLGRRVGKALIGASSRKPVAGKAIGGIGLAAAAVGAAWVV